MKSLLLDTYSLFFRAFYALPPMNTSDGAPTNALYGLSALLIKLLREERPDAAAFAIDTPQPTFRHREYKGYKASRQRPPDPLLDQLGVLDELLGAWGFPVHRAPGYEADDVLATLARDLASQSRVVIVSGDRDVLQLVSDAVTVLFVGRRGRPPVRYDEAAVAKRFGLSPQQLPSYVALVGDPSDNLPKVPGVGEKTATRLIQSYGDVAGVLDHLGEIGPAKLRSALARHREQIARNEDLARLRDDLPLGSAARVAPLTEEALKRTRALFERLEFGSLLPRIGALLP